MFRTTAEAEVEGNINVAVFSISIPQWPPVWERAVRFTARAFRRRLSICVCAFLSLLGVE